MRLYSILMCLSFAVIANAFGAAGEFNPARHHPAAESRPAVQRIIVKLRTAEMATAPAADDAVVSLTQRTHLALKESRRIAGRMHVMQVEPAVSGESAAATLARLRADPAVEYAEIDQRRYAHAIPNDPLYTGQWYLQNAGATPSAVDAVTAWDTTTGSNGIVIADLDTGVRFDHPDLLRAGAGGRLLPGYDFITDIATANDGNGRDADASDPGDACGGADSSWHGTRVAGILGAITNNSTGIAGLTWNSWLVPVRVLGKCGGFDSDIIDGMVWAANLHLKPGETAVPGIPDNPYPAQIENLSLGGTGACPQSYRDVISHLTAIGVLVVASAGNEGGPVDSPANCSGVAGVAGLRHIGTKVGYSSLGPEIALSAPAGNCVNTSPGAACQYSIDTTTNLGTTTPGANSYTDQINYNVGTSFSAPIVAGIAALMKAVNGNLDSAQLIARLKEGATPFPVSSDPTIPTCLNPANITTLQDECNCTTQTCGAGMANAANAVAAALRPIAAISVPASVSPGQNVTLQGGGSAAACNHSVSAYSWSIVSGGSPGIIGANTATATITAPTTGSYTVRLTVTDDAGRQDTADVVVSPNAVATTAPATAGTNACPAVTVSVVVAPASTSVQAVTGTKAFAATVLNTLNTAVTWQVNNVTGGNATVGTISTSGVYTAPASVPSPATVTVTAVSVADTSRTGSAQVTVTPPVTASSGSGSGGGGGGGGGAIDALTLLAGVLVVARRMTRQGTVWMLPS